MLKGRCVVLGVTGGIACYKSCEIVSRLVKLGAEVHVIMTENSQNFVAPLTFESLSNNPCTTDTFKRVATWNVQHVSLAQKADILVIAPATANIIGKIAGGIADDMLSTTVMACKAPKLICPAMNTAMYDNVFYRDNESKLAKGGYHIVAPTVGRLACGDTGQGKMVEPSEIVDEIVKILLPQQDLLGKKILISCGGTCEPIDSVRVIANHSSGKMGRSIAEECIRRGGMVTIVRGNVSVNTPNVDKTIDVVTTMDMYSAVLDNIGGMDYIIMAAAPADYKVDNVALHKIKGETLTLKLVKNPDIARAIGGKKTSQKLIIFSAESEDLIYNAQAKLAKKNADMVVANDITMEGAGFNVDTNIVTIIKANGDSQSYDIMTKQEVAKQIVNKMLEL